MRFEGQVNQYVAWLNIEAACISTFLVPESTTARCIAVPMPRQECTTVNGLDTRRRTDQWGGSHWTVDGLGAE